MSCSLKLNDMAINLALLKRIRFYHLLDPSSKKIFNLNVYQIVLILFTFICECLLIYGLSGYLIQIEDTTDSIDALLVIFFTIINLLSVIKAITFMYKAKDIWCLFNVTRINFLSSVQCRAYNNIHNKYGDISKKISYFLFVMALLGNLVWGVYPLVIYKTSFENVHADGTINRRIENIVNYPFPVTVSTFNSYFICFYFMELMILTFNLVLYGVFDIFIVSFSFAFIAQYEIIFRSFENVDYDECRHQNNDKNYYVGNFYDDYKSILIEQKKLYLMLKLFYSIIWYIILLSVGLLSGAIIILSYCSVVIFLSAESLPMVNIFKISIPIFSITIELFLFCYLMEMITNKKESVVFGMYSSNWTAMNLKSKKLLLLAMAMNNANKMMIKTTPNKIINLQLFASVMMRCNNIVSVLLKTRSK